MGTAAAQTAWAERERISVVSPDRLRMTVSLFRRRRAVDSRRSRTTSTALCNVSRMRSRSMDDYLQLLLVNWTHTETECLHSSKSFFNKYLHCKAVARVTVSDENLYYWCESANATWGGMVSPQSKPGDWSLQCWLMAYTGGTCLYVHGKRAQVLSGAGEAVALYDWPDLTASIVVETPKPRLFAAA